MTEPGFEPRSYRCPGKHCDLTATRADCCVAWVIWGKNSFTTSCPSWRQPATVTTSTLSFLRHSFLRRLFDAILQKLSVFIVVYRPRNCSLNWWAACCLFIICLSLSVFPSCNTVSVKNGWPMLYWQPAKCCIFQLFIIICYLANKVLLLLRFFSYSAH